MHFIVRLMAAAACVATLAPARAAAPTLAGMLKCTAEVAQAGETATRNWKVACAFEPVKGQVQHYVGAINDPGTAPRETGKAFLVWNVLTAAPDVPSGMLVGTYKGKAGTKGLVGGRKGAVVLEPVTGPNQDDGINVAPRVSAIQLELPNV